MRMDDYHRPKEPRNREILEALAAKEAPRQVAAKHGITKQRVSFSKRRAIRRGEYPPKAAREPSFEDAMSAAREIGLSEDLAREIRLAADNAPGHNPELRRKILAALGLEEPPDTPEENSNGGR